MPVNFAEFALDLRYDDLPDTLLRVLRRSFVDTMGVVAVASRSDMAEAARTGAVALFGPGEAGGARILMDGRRVSPAGAAMAGAFTVDAIDAHDTTTPCKGHVGSAVFPALLAMADVSATPLDPSPESMSSARMSATATVFSVAVTSTFTRAGCAVVSAPLMRAGEPRSPRP